MPVRRSKKYVKHTRKEKAHLRAVQRRSGPSAVRRRERRHEVLETLECGCQRTRVRMVTCPTHTVPTVSPAALPQSDDLSLHGAEGQSQPAAQGETVAADPAVEALR